MPPSPLWSACITNITYLMVTTMISAQNISDRIPNKSSRSKASPWEAATWRHSLSV